MSIINCTNKMPDKELPPTGNASVGDILTLETGKVPAWKTPIHKIIENIQNTDDLHDWLRNATIGDMLIFTSVNAKNGTDGQEGTDGCFTLGADNKLYGSCVVDNESDIYGGSHIRPCLTYIQFTSNATKVKMCYLADQLLTIPPTSTIVSITGMVGVRYVRLRYDSCLVQTVRAKPRLDRLSSLRFGFNHGWWMLDVPRKA